MEIDTIATYDAEKIRNLMGKGKPLNNIAARFGYTTSEAKALLDHAAKNHHILVGWHEMQFEGAV